MINCNLKYLSIDHLIKRGAFIIFCILIQSCKDAKVNKESIFKKIPSTATGLQFTNSITENDTVNLIVNEYTYMGGGVGIGDFNNDGLQDIFFSANQVSSRLYIN